MYCVIALSVAIRVELDLEKQKTYTQHAANETKPMPKTKPNWTGFCLCFFLLLPFSKSQSQSEFWMWVKLLKMWQTQKQSRPVAPCRVPEQRNTHTPCSNYTQHTPPHPERGIDHANLPSAYLAINLNLDSAQIRQIRRSAFGLPQRIRAEETQHDAKQKKSKSNEMKRNETKQNKPNRESVNETKPFWP